MGYDGWTDGQLLDRWLADGAEQAAFEEIVRRHGPMVLGVCRRVCGGRAGDAEDATQLVFATLARRASAVAGRASLGGWLNRVAYHTARRLWRSAQVRARHERHAAQARRPAAAPPPEAGVLLIEEVYLAMESLPDEFREPIVLHHLEGHTVEEAARLMACRVGTVASRLSRGRELLRKRLERRGIMLSAAAMGALMARESEAAAAGAAAFDAQRVTASTLASVSGTAAASAALAGLPMDWGTGWAGTKAGASSALATYVVGLPAGLLGLLRPTLVAIAMLASGGALAATVGYVAAQPAKPKAAAAAPETKPVDLDLEFLHSATRRSSGGSSGGASGVPEPGVAMLLAAAAGFVALRPRRRGQV